MKKEEFKAIIESILFVSAKPVTIGRLREVLNLPAETVLSLITSVQEEYKDRGFNVVLTKKGYAFVPNERFKKYYVKFARVKKRGLSKQALEVIAILLKADATKERIDKLRGVNSSRMLNELLKKGYISRTFKNGKVVYGITEKLIARLPKNAKEKLSSVKLFKND